MYSELSKIRKLEEDGYDLDGYSYTQGDAFWWVSLRGEHRISPMKQNQRPVYPEGDWYLVARTTDGDVVYDNSYKAAKDITDLYLIKKEKHYER